MDLLSSCAQQVKVPTVNDNIYSEECVYSFDTPETETGLYISLTSFLGLGKDHVERYFQKTHYAVFLHIQRIKTEIPQSKDESEEGPEKKITRLAIGLEGGLQDNASKKKYSYEDVYSIVVFPSQAKIPFPSDGIPAVVNESVKAIISSESAFKKFEKEQMTGTWDGEMREISVYALELQQNENGKKIPPTGWKCEKCDLTNNLWLNLTDGSILCGRKYFDGSGGNEHAAEHYQEVKHPLAVKLGTITADGKADVYSYAENDMVVDPFLQKHLAHFGINIGEMTKTEKSMIEMEIELNQRVGEWSLLQESAANLQPVAGPGLTGMENLGNSCYLNSVMQVIFTVPDFIRRYVEKAGEIFANAPSDVVNDFNVQMAKLGTGLWSGKYSSIREDAMDSGNGIKPTMFKNLIGKSHQDFATKQQQDAQEFLLHLLNIIERNSRSQENPSDALKFKIEDRVQCMASQKVKYSYRDEWCLPVPIPLHLATNLDEVRAYEEMRQKAAAEGRRLTDESLVRPKIPLRTCLEKFAEADIVEQFYSTAINDKTTATKQARLASLPDYLLLHLKKFTMREDWTSLKLDVSIECPDEIDISFLRGNGLLPSEEELPELKGHVPTPPPMDPEVLKNLQDMGFPFDACKKAVFFTKNSGLEPATNWIMQHIGDVDFGSPFVVPGQEGGKKDFEPNEEGLASIISMGFSVSQATKALKATSNNAERAIDYIFSHQDELDMEDIQESQPASSAGSQIKNVRDGGSKYRLKAFISHMGSSSQVGHYVCHILKDGQWVIFNDNKVALSQAPPKDLGYLYLYERIKN